MTLGTTRMRRCINKCISMTRGTVIRRSCRYDGAVIWGGCMQTTPVCTVTRCTVAAGREVLTYRRACQGAVTRMT